MFDGNNLKFRMPINMDANEGKNTFSMGQRTWRVPMKLFALNRQRLCERLISESIQRDTVVFLEGGEICNLYNTDVEYNVFRQEPFFFWAFGVTEPSFLGIIHVSTGRSILFTPELSEEYTVWMGKLPELEEYAKKYEVDEVYYTHQIVDVLSQMSVSTILTLKGVNSDSKLPFKEPTFNGIEKFQVCDNVLYDIISDCRVIKTDYEKDAMRYAAKISSDAHKAVMKIARPGTYEYQCESTFLHYVYSVGGCRHAAYTCICASGENGGILHYGHAAKPNDKLIREGDLCTFDMGSSYCGYASDITVTFPANGKFSEDQKIVYNAVLAANLAVQKTAKPGVSWVDMHILANRVMLEKLKEAGLVKGYVEDMLRDDVAAIFQPHGLGHLLGLDVHDVGGYIDGTPPRPTRPGLSSLRTARILKAGMAITIEPGCYFIQPVLKSALNDPIKSKYLNEEALKRFQHCGGVRIEDDVFITEQGVENYTKVPRTIEEIENWMKDGKVLRNEKFVFSQISEAV